MSEQINLREIELKAWKSVFQDGLYDIWLGWLILQLGIVHLITRFNLSRVGDTVTNMGMYMLSILCLYLGKRFITVPRAGRVKFGPRRMSRILKIGIISFVCVAVVFVLTLRAIAGKSILPVGVNSALVLALLLLVFFSLWAFFLDYTRLYLIGVMFALPYLLQPLFYRLWGIDLDFWAWALPAVVVITMGLVTLRRFLRDYPIPALQTGDIANEEG